MINYMVLVFLRTNTSNTVIHFQKTNRDNKILLKKLCGVQKEITFLL